MRTLRIDEGNLNDDDLKAVGQLKEIENFECSDNPITDAALLHLRPLQHLRCLKLVLTKNTNRCTQEIARLSALEELSLNNGNTITGVGLAELKKLRRLRKLELWETPTSDAGVKEIATLTGLEELVLRHADIADGA